MYLRLCSYTISVRWNGTLTLNQHRDVTSHPYWSTLLLLLSKNLQYIYKIDSYRSLQIIEVFWRGDYLFHSYTLKTVAL